MVEYSMDQQGQYRNDIAKRERYYKWYKNSHSHDVLLKFKSLRNMIVSKIRTAKKEFFENLASSISDTKKFWSTIQSIQPRVDFSSCSLTDGSTTVSDNSDKATMLNNFFASCFIRRLFQYSTRQHPLPHAVPNLMSLTVSLKRCAFF